MRRRRLSPPLRNAAFCVSPELDKFRLVPNRKLNWDQLVERQRYVVHIKHRRRRGEPVVEEGAAPGETQYPAHRGVVERTFGWLARRRSLHVRWGKKAENWLAFIHLACAHHLMDMTVYG